MPTLLDCQRGIVTKDFRVVSQELGDAILKGREDSRARNNVIEKFQSFNFFFGIKLRVLVLRHRDNSSSTLRYTYMYRHEKGSESSNINEVIRSLN